MTHSSRGLPRTNPPQEATGKRIACAIGVDNLTVLQRVHFIDLRGIRLIRRDCDSGQRTLSDDDSSGTGGVGFGEGGEGFGEGGEGFGDGRDIGLIWEAGCSGPGSRFGFVADDDVTVREDLFELDFEELGDEGSGDVDNEDLHGHMWQDLVISTGVRRSAVTIHSVLCVWVFGCVCEVVRTSASRFSH